MSTHLSTFQLIIGFSAALVFSWLAWRSGSLTFSGALAATLVGGIVFGLGGPAWAVPLLVFFISSSLLSRLSSASKTSARVQFAKGYRRDWAQVLANGGLPSLLVIMHVFFPSLLGVWIAYCAALATVNADTWSTELGILNPKPPRLITTGKPVEAGTSGGISLYGSLAAAGGALIIGISSSILNPIHLISKAGILIILVVALSGLFGAVVDSLLGASVQGIYFCPSCRKETERHPTHTCGIATTHFKGWDWLNNDLVNFLSSLAGSLSAFTFVLLITLLPA